MCICENPDGFVLWCLLLFHVGLSVFAYSAKYTDIVSRPLGECSITIYFFDID